MAEYVEFLVQSSDGWLLVAMFRFVEDCEAVASLVRVGWGAKVACVLNTGA